MISITVPGPPCAKGRPRISTRGGFARAYTPAKTVAYEGLVALAGETAMAGASPYAGAVVMEVTARFAIPVSWSKRKRAEAAAGVVRPTGKPDCDNLLKAIGDGLNGIAYRDDAQVVRASIVKLYAETPGVDIIVEAL